MIEYIKEKPHEECGWSGEGWYFWDEIYQYCYGPYESIAIAKLKLGEYLNHLEDESCEY